MIKVKTYIETETILSADEEQEFRETYPNGFPEEHIEESRKWVEREVAYAMGSGTTVKANVIIFGGDE